MTTTQTRSSGSHNKRYTSEAKVKVIVSDRALGILTGVAFAISIVSGASCWWLAREYKLVQIQLMYTNALMIREGMVRPGDMVFGPEGNLEFDGNKFKPKPKEK